MARKQTKPKKSVVENPEAETVVDTVETNEPEAVQGTEATVWRGSFPARKYTQKKHGDTFADLAEEYAKHNGGRVVVR
jgi:hypothetical protein